MTKIFCQDCSVITDSKQINRHDDTCPIMIDIENMADADVAYFQKYKFTDSRLRKLSWGETQIFLDMNFEITKEYRYQIFPTHKRCCLIRNLVCGDFTYAINAFFCPNLPYSARKVIEEDIVTKHFRNRR